MNKYFKYVCLVACTLSLAIMLGACGNQTADWQEQYDLGQQAEKVGNYEKAMISYGKAITVNDSLADAYIGRGDAYSSLYADIIKSDYIPVEKELADCAANASVCLQRAVDDYSSAIKLEPSEINSYNKIIAACIDLNDKDSLSQWYK